MNKRYFFNILVCLVIIIIVFILAISLNHINATIRLMNSEDPPVWYTAPAREIITRKRACRDYTTTILKMIFMNCDTGFPRWGKFIQTMTKECQRLPQVDHIVGITSGGWLIADIICKVLNRPPAIKLTYSRYNHNKSFRKTLMFFQGHKTAKIDPDWTTEEHAINMSVRPEMIRGRTCLLIDDSVGSGATINVCKRYLEGCGSAKVYTYVVCAAKPNTVDLCYTNKHFVIFPWGLDV